MEFLGNHILSIDQFDKDDIVKVFSIAEKMIPYANREKKTRVLQGAILSNMLFEASTRTRISFGSAFNLLGGEVRETTGIEASSLAKGESLYDTARVLSGYSDLIVMRHPEKNSVQEFSEASRVPVINAGDGENEHPSQALLDLFTIKLELESKGKSIDGSNIALVGDLKFGRAVHSLCKALNLFEHISFNLISPEQLKLPPEIRQDLVYNGMKINEFNSIESGIGDVDIIYVTRVQEERFDSPKEANKYKGLLKLNQNIYTENCEPNTVIMHPLPRDSRPDANELDTDMNENPNLAIYRQTDNGLLVRMALISLILGVDQTLSDYDEDISWVSSKKSN